MAKDKIDINELNAATLKELFRKLATDDSYREKMTKEPAACLKDHGITLPDSAKGEPVELPSKEQFAALLVKLEAPGGLNEVIHDVITAYGGGYSAAYGGGYHHSGPRR